MTHSTMQKVNSFAHQAFRDTADRDYIHARMAYRAKLFPQFHWSALHALEKYAKCISILTRMRKPKKSIKHEISRSLDLISEKVDIPLSAQTGKFIDRLEKYGARFRYMEVSWFIHEPELAILDRAVWELRRYCNAGAYAYENDEFISFKPGIFEKLSQIDVPTKANTYVPGGFIEKTLENRDSETRPHLVWFNLYYSSSNRKSVLMRSSTSAENSFFHLFPEIVDEVAKYVYIPKEVKNAYKNS